MTSKKAILLLLCCLWGILPMIAQVEFEAAKRLTTKEGLPDNDVRDIVQTPDGFIWMGTKNGLCKFDGVNFKTYLHNPDDPNSIFDHRIHDLLVVDSQEIWIGTQLGFSVLDLKTERFQNYQVQDCQLKDSLERNPNLRALRIEKSRSGEILISTTDQGLVRFYPEKDSITCYPYPLEKVRPLLGIPKTINYVLSIYSDNFNDSLIWVGTSAGLLEVNIFTNQIEWYVNAKVNEPIQKSKNSFRKIYQDSKGLLYLGTWSAKVLVFDPVKKQFSPLAFKNKSVDGREEGLYMIGGVIEEIIGKNKKEIWITTGRGVMEYNTETEECQHVRKNQIKGDFKYGVKFVDDHGRAWLNTAVGLYIFDPIRQQFIEYSFLELNLKAHGYSYYFPRGTPNEEVAVLPRSANGIFYLHPQKRSWRKVAIPEQYLLSENNFAAKGWSLSPTGQWTLINFDYLINFDPNKEQFRQIEVPLHLRNKNYLSVYWDSNGRLWVGTVEAGMFRWTPDQNKWEIFKTELEPDSSSVQTSNIGDFFEDSRQNIWFKRENGFSVYSFQQDTFYNFLTTIHAEKAIQPARAFAEDREGKVWVLSAEGRLAYGTVDHPETGIIKKFDFKETNQMEDVYFMKTNSEGMLWTLCDAGLFLMDPKSMAIKEYNLKYGIDDPSVFGFEVLPDDRLLIGGRNKVWMADPKNLVKNTELPKPYLTSVSILEEPIKRGISLNYMSKLDLKHWENFFSIGFSAIGFTFGEENEFRYQLEGLNEKWINAGNQRIANYTNVPSGDYTFKLQAKNNEGIWNEEIFSLPISIATPWWQRAWFYMITAIASILLIYAVYRFRLSQMLKEERVRSDFERRLLEVEMSALRAQMNPHFLFNCLNSIERYVIKNDTIKASKYLNNFARLIRLILQNSRSNYIKLTDEIKTLELYLEMETLRFQEKFRYQINVGENVHPDTINIPPMLLQPFIENAIWHGLMNKKDKENGLIKLDITQQNGYLICMVEDNGVGRETAAEIKQRRPVTGKKSIGMKITSDRIQMLNQAHNSDTSIDIIDLKTEDGVGCGTRIILKIPI